MVEQRRHARVSCSDHCHLVHRDGSAFPAFLTDISVGGAMVKIEHRTGLQEGDLIALKLFEGAVFHPAKHISRIVRIDSKNNFGLKFLVKGSLFKVHDAALAA